MKTTVQTLIDAPIAVVWQAWTTPSHICQWNFADDSWCCPAAEIDLREGGSFSYRMQARDGSMGFDFGGTFTHLIPGSALGYVMEDGREVQVTLRQTPEGVLLEETFDNEDQHTAEQQRQGWQAILNNFRHHVDSLVS
ncbi:MULTISPECIES: SRPBCC family protein [Shewanella]|uniref:SRPBCC family protein n=1 Tax=Shewanella TaxID=22 RepID=UPI001C6563F1|nr:MULTISPECIES: SRPBCC family protein [Shewanella]QYJ76748.1 SRPBCC family protein [Shewanella sp. FJAT-52076]QYK06664.1 SRPBCC family protein [Shewanella zhangzhouensis]